MRITSPVALAVLSAVSALAALVQPSVAEACAVCFPGTDESQMAFIITTGILTFLPLTLIGGTVYWINRRAKLRELQRRSPEYLAQHLLD